MEGGWGAEMRRGGAGGRKTNEGWGVWRDNWVGIKTKTDQEGKKGKTYREQKKIRPVC